MSLLLCIPTPAAAERTVEVDLPILDGPCKLFVTCSCPLNPQDYLFRLGDYIEECQHN